MANTDKFKIKSGDLILRRSKQWDIFGWGIRTLTESYFNHVGIVVPIGKLPVNSRIKLSDHNKLCIIEASGKVIITDLDEFINPNKFETKVVRVNPNVYKDGLEGSIAYMIAISRAVESINKGYDWLAIPYLGIKCLARGILKKLLPNWNPLQSRYKFFCSELACYCYYDTSSLYKCMFAGEKHPEQGCDTITPCDVSKSKNVIFITGVDNI